MNGEFKLLANEETERLIHEAQQGSEAAKERLMNCNYPLIKSIVKRYMNRGVDYDDLYQLGSLGFVKAINNFDIKYGVKFSTYAVPMIAGEIKRFLRDDGSIKVSRSIKSLAIKVNQYIDNERKLKNNIPTVAELAKEFEVEESEIVFALDSAHCLVSLHEKTDDKTDSSPSLLDKIVGENNEDKTIEKIILKEAIAELDLREKKIIMLRYFRGKTQTEIARMMNVSQVQISRIESKILKKIRSKM